MSAGDERIAGFVRRVRARERVCGYWVVLDAPPAVERLARAGFDFLCFDAQHGLFGYAGMVAGLTATDAGGGAVGMVRVGANDAAAIGRALDAGAVGVVVPLVDTPDDARRAVAAATYPPGGNRSYGPMRAGLRIGPDLAEADRTVLVLAMIETVDGLANVEAICAVPGLAGVFVGPVDLRIALGGTSPGDPGVDDRFDAAIERVLRAAAAAGVVAGCYAPDGATAAYRLAQGFTLVTVGSDLSDLVAAAVGQLQRARSAENASG